MTVVGPKSTGKKKPASKRSPSTKKYDATKPRIQPPNKRTGQDYQDYQKKKQAEAHKRQVEKHNKAMQEEYMRNIPKMAPKPKAKSKSPKMGSAEGWADLRSRIKKAKEKEKKSRKTLPYTI